MLRKLWAQREKHPLLSVAWARAWAKRLQQLPAAFHQARARRRLERAGATIAGDVYFSDSSLIAGGAIEQLSIGQDTYIGRAVIATHAKITIGQHVCINDGAKLLAASHDLTDPEWRHYAKPIHVDDYAWIATDAIVLPGVTVGRGAVVGAGAVVSRDVDPFAVVAGNPAQVLPTRRPDDLAYSPVRFLALYTAWYGPPHGVASNAQ